MFLCNFQMWKLEEYLENIKFKWIFSWIVSFFAEAVHLEVLKIRYVSVLFVSVPKCLKRQYLQVKVIFKLCAETTWYDATYVNITFKLNFIQTSCLCCSVSSSLSSTPVSFILCLVYEENN